MGSVRLSTAAISLSILIYCYGDRSSIPRPFNLEGVGVRELGSSEAESLGECYLDCHICIILPLLNAHNQTFHNTKQRLKNQAEKEGIMATPGS